MTAAADRHRVRVVELAVLGDDGPTIAATINLSLRQVRRYLAEPDVRQQIRELEAERLRTVARKAAAMGGSAVAVLATIANDTGQPAPARVSAARALLDTMVRVGELAALEERIAALEAGMAKGGGAEWKPRAV